MIKTCPICHSNFEKKKCDSIRYFDVKIFCSQRCYGDSKIGMKWSEESKEKLSNSTKGHRSYSVSGPDNPKWSRVEKTCKTCGNTFLVRNYRKDDATYCSRKCATDDNLGLSTENEKQRRSLAYRLWRESVFIRDEFTCQECGNKGYIIAHHIKPFSLFPKLRLDINNGITLCKKCHSTKHKGLRRKLAVMNNF